LSCGEELDLLKKIIAGGDHLKVGAPGKGYGGVFNCVGELG